MKKRFVLRGPSISLSWRCLLFLQAAMVAWIGFTHGSGLELYLFKFTTVSYKSVFYWDQNLATLVAVLAFLTLWRAFTPVLGLLSAIYLGQTLLLSRYGGFVDDPLPLLGMAAHVALPLSFLALKGQRWAVRLGQIALFATLAYYVGLFFNAPPYYLDPLFQLSQRLGFALGGAAAQALLVGIGLALCLAFFLEGRRLYQPILVGIFSVGLALLHGIHFGLAPEAVLKLAPFVLSALLWRVSRSRNK